MDTIPHFPLLIPGGPAGAKTTEVTAPYDGSPIATVATGGQEAVETALTTGHALYTDRAKWLSPTRRIEILDAAASIMETRADELAIEAAREGGKPLPDSIVEVARAIDSVRICIETLRTESGEVIPMNVNAASAQRMAFTRHEPIGVVVAVSAFNHPLNLIAHQVAPAVATGCPVIVKPAEVTPLSCFRFVEILHEAGLPPEWCQALVTDGREVSEALVTDPRVAFFSFIGSARVGWHLRSKLAPGARCALEHGGAAPVIVAPDVDMDRCCRYCSRVASITPVRSAFPSNVSLRTSHWRANWRTHGRGGTTPDRRRSDGREDRSRSLDPAWRGRPGARVGRGSA